MGVLGERWTKWHLLSIYNPFHVVLRAFGSGYTGVFFAPSGIQKVALAFFEAVASDFCSTLPLM